MSYKLSKRTRKTGYLSKLYDTNGVDVSEEQDFGVIYMIQIK